MKYLIIVEKTDTGDSAYSPDLPGCITTGATHKEIEDNMREAIQFHLDGLRLGGEAIPSPSSSSAHVEVPVQQIALREDLFRNLRGSSLR